MTVEEFRTWLNDLKELWKTKKPEKIINIISDDIIWHETPFTKPYRTKEEVLKDWEGILNQNDILFSYKILSFRDNQGIAQWTASFTKTASSGEKVLLDGIFVITFNDEGKCSEFRQWVQSKE